jgi:hypothetical protein
MGNLNEVTPALNSMQWRQAEDIVHKPIYGLQGTVCDLSSDFSVAGAEKAFYNGGVLVEKTLGPHLTTVREPQCAAVAACAPSNSVFASDPVVGLLTCTTVPPCHSAHSCSRTTRIGPSQCKILATRGYSMPRHSLEKMDVTRR